MRAEDRGHLHTTGTAVTFSNNLVKINSVLIKLGEFLPSFQKNTFSWISVASALVTARRTSRYVTLRIS